MGRKTQGNSTAQKDNSLEDLVGNEENEYPVPDLKRTKTDITNGLSTVHKKIYQRGNHGQDH
jgi:hypothetical protein